MKSEKKNNPPEKSRKITPRQAAAMTGVILLVLMYIVTLIMAIVDKSRSGYLFLMCLIATIAIPSLIWIYTWLYGQITGKHTFADFDLGQTGSSNEKKTD